MSDDDDVIDRPMLARRLGVADSTVEAWTREKRIPCLRPSRKVIRYSWSAVLAALRPTEPSRPHLVGRRLS